MIILSTLLTEFKNCGRIEGVMNMVMNMVMQLERTRRSRNPKA